MAQRLIRSVSRRNFIKGAGALSASLTTALLVPGRASAQQKTLKILQWNHFVPGYDKWFNETYVKAWGEKNNTNVMVDNIGLAGLNSRAAAEVSAQKGHDLFMFLWPPPVHEDQVIDHREIYEECERKYGKPIDLAIKSTYNPKTKKYYGFSDSYVPDPINYRKDLWDDVGVYPDSWDDIRAGGKKIKQKHNIPVGIGLASEIDTSYGHARHHVFFWLLGARCGRESGTQIQRDSGGDQVRQGTVRGGHDRRGLYLGRLV